MARKIYFSVFISVVLIGLFLAPIKAEDEAASATPQPVTVSLDFKDAGIKEVLKAFSIQSGMNFIASDSLQDRKVTLYFDKVPINEAVKEFLRSSNLAYEFDKKANIILITDLGKPPKQLVTKVFYLKNATVASSNLQNEIYNNLQSTTTSGTSGSTSSSLGGGISSSTSGSGTNGIGTVSTVTQVVTKLLSSDGKVIEDSRTNSLVVTDIAINMETIAKTIAALDVPVTQVMLEVEMLDVSKNTTEQIGFKFGSSPFTATLTGASMPVGYPFASWLKAYHNLGDATQLGSIAINSSSSTAYTAIMQFIKTQTDTKFLARPKLLTLNNQTAEIKIATQESVGISTSTASTGVVSATPERAETGVTLRVTPQINPDTGEITMFIYPKVGAATAGNTLTSNNNSFTFRDPEQRSTKSVVRIKDGDTVIIGGLIRNESTQTVTKLPILGDLPLIGRAFRHKDMNPNKQRELLVFITPHLIKDSTMILAQAKKTVLPEREQAMATGVSRQAVINDFLNNLYKKNR